MFKVISYTQKNDAHQFIYEFKSITGRTVSALIEDENKRRGIIRLAESCRSYILLILERAIEEIEDYFNTDISSFLVKIQSVSTYKIAQTGINLIYLKQAIEELKKIILKLN